MNKSLYELKTAILAVQSALANLNVQLIHIQQLISAVEPEPEVIFYRELTPEEVLRHDSEIDPKEAYH